MAKPASLSLVRAWYAEELRSTGPVESDAVVRAFARVPRERFVGPGPWRIYSDTGRGGYRTTPNADPRRVYHNVLVTLDETQGINNGSPALWAFVLDHLNLAPAEHVLHLGCGTGYYSAIMAELVGRDGHVVAVERDAALAARARKALAARHNVTFVEQDGARYAPKRQDAVVVSAGATHPLPGWLAALRPGGRLVFPLTSTALGGYMLLITRMAEADRLAAELLCPAGFIPFVGGRDAALDDRLAAAIERGNTEFVRSLRLDIHAQDESCWLHADTFCLSWREPDPPPPA